MVRKCDVEKVGLEQAAKATTINQFSEVLIHREDGSISERSSYGSGPYRPKGRAKPLLFKPGAKATEIFFVCTFLGGLDWCGCLLCLPPVSPTSLTFSQPLERRKK